MKQISGKIPLMSTMVQPSADLYSRNKFVNFFFSCSILSLKEIITRKVSPEPKNMCFKPLGNWDSSIFSVFRVDSFGFSLSRGNSSKLGCQNFFTYPVYHKKTTKTLKVSTG